MALAVCKTLQAWKEDVDPEPPDDLCPDLRTVLAAQDNIDWGTVLKGLISDKWRRLIKDHLSTIGSSQSVDRWASAFASRCSCILRSLWNARNKAVHKNTSALDPRDNPAQNGANKPILQITTPGALNFSPRSLHTCSDRIWRD